MGKIRWNELNTKDDAHWKRKKRIKLARSEMRKEKYDFVWKNLLYSPKQVAETKGE